MSCCARCGEEICTAAGKIALNKVWHRGCFCCYGCNRPLQVNTAKIFFGEVFCKCCYPEVQQMCPLKMCRVSSSPSFSQDCCSRKCVKIKPVSYTSSESDNCRVRDAHSCGCIPVCCKRNFPYNINSCEPREDCSKRIQHLPRIKKPHNYPPRNRSPCTCCSHKTNNNTKRKKTCPTMPNQRKQRSPCSGSRKKKMIFFEPCANSGSDEQCCRCSACRAQNSKTDRCRRCGEKVFAAEKILTSSGSYHLGCFSCYCCCKSLCVKTMYEGCGEIYCKQCYNNFFGINAYGYY